MAADNGQQPEPEPQQVAPDELPFSSQVKPTGYKVSVHPKTGIIRLRFTFTIGIVDVVLEEGKELDAMIEDLKAANIRARSGLVVGGSAMKGITGS